MSFLFLYLVLLQCPLTISYSFANLYRFINSSCTFAILMALNARVIRLVAHSTQRRRR